MRSAVGLADLARLCRAFPVDDRLEVAALLGFEKDAAIAAIGGVDPAARRFGDA